FAFVLEPMKLKTMMDSLDDLPPQEAAEWAKTVERLEQNRQGIIIGKDRLALLNKRVGDRIKLYGINYRGLDFEVEIVGIFPPAPLVSLSLVMANAIGISVRQRRMELAVMKVLGFRPLQILLLVLGESLLLGVTAGFLSSGLTWLLVNRVYGGIPFPIAFFSKIFIADDALWWGPAVGAFAAIAGSLSPAWSACRVQVSEVSAKVPL